MNNETSKKILNLLNESSDSKFLNKSLNLVNDHTSPNYSAGNIIRCNIRIIGCNIETSAAFKNYAPFIKYITKLDQQ